MLEIAQYFLGGGGFFSSEQQQQMRDPEVSKGRIGRGRGCSRGYRNCLPSCTGERNDEASTVHTSKYKLIIIPHSPTTKMAMIAAVARADITLAMEQQGGKTKRVPRRKGERERGGGQSVPVPHQYEPSVGAKSD